MSCESIRPLELGYLPPQSMCILIRVYMVHKGPTIAPRLDVLITLQETGSSLRQVMTPIGCTLPTHLSCPNITLDTHHYTRLHHQPCQSRKYPLDYFSQCQTSQSMILLLYEIKYVLCIDLETSNQSNQIHNRCFIH